MSKNTNEWDDAFLYCEENLTPQVQRETAETIISNLKHFLPSDFLFVFKNNELSIFKQKHQINGRTNGSSFEKTVIFNFKSANNNNYSPLSS